MRERFESNLLAYARGELPREEAIWMEGFIAEHPDAKAEAEVLMQMFDALSWEASNLQCDPEDGLASLRAKFIVHHAGRTKPVAGGANKPGQKHPLWDRVKAGMQQVRDRISPGGTTLHVQFNASASEAEIRALLNQVHGRIVNGPDGRANYSVKVPRKDSKVALDEFQASPIVDNAHLGRSAKKQ